MKEFIHLNVKSEYTILNSIAKIKEIIRKVSMYPQPYVALTDINNMHIVYTFEKLCHTTDSDEIQNMERMQEVQNIVGVTFCVKDMFSTYGNITLLAYNLTGYKNLVKLSTIANSGEEKTGKNKFAHIQISDLKDCSEGIICLTGGIDGSLFKYIIGNDSEKAEQLIQFFLNTFTQENVYVELMNHFIPVEKDFLTSSLLKDLITKYDLEVVATNNVYYIEKEHAYHRALGVEMNPNPTGLDVYSRYVDYNDEFYLKTPQEMEIAFEDFFDDYPEAFENTLRIAKRCQNVRVPKEQALPEFPIPAGYTNASYLEKLMWEGFEERFPNISGDEKKELEERILYEYDIICKMGFVDYHLIVADFIQWAKDDLVYQHPERYFPSEYFSDYSALHDIVWKKDFPILVGPGRGSAAGSLLCYCLKITNINPMENGLLFERFLNPERVSMPDIDIDFPNEYRHLLVLFVQNKYGYEKVSQIATFQTLGPKSIIKSVGKALGIPYYETNDMTKNIPLEVTKLVEDNEGNIIEKKVEVTLLSQLEGVDYFKMKMATNELVKELFQIGKVLEGLPSATGKHAAGVIIGHKALENYLPLMEVDGVMVTQFEKGDAEGIGLLKMDFLGLQTLDIFKEACSLIKQYHGVDIDLDALPLDDKTTYEEIFQKGKTGKIFQFESSGMRDLLRKMRPNSIKDLTAANAAYRPGPMEFIPEYLEGRKNASTVHYPAEAYEEVAKETFGILLYQEQIMQIVQKMAGFSLGEADVLRRGIGKKIAKYIEQGRQQFVSGCIKLGTADEKTAEEIYETIQKFAAYGFNKSHSAAYGLVAYQEGYLKAHYPECFMAANLTICSQDAKKLAYTLSETKKMGISILPPDIKASKERFLIEEHDGQKAIRFSTAAIKAIGEDNARIYASIKDKSSLDSFLADIPAENLRTNQITNLIHSGAFDYLGVRKEMVQYLPKLIELTKQKNHLKQAQSPELLSLLPVAKTFDGYEYPTLEKLHLEKNCLQIALSGHPVGAVRSIAKVSETLADILPQDNDVSMGQEIEVVCMISDYKSIITKKGKNMAFATVEDEYVELEAVIFPDVYEDYLSVMDELVGQPVIIKGTVQYNFDESGKDIETKIFVSHIAKVIKETYKIYIDKTSISQKEINEIAKENGIAEVILVDTAKKEVEKLPFTIDLQASVLRKLKSCHAQYIIKK